MKKWYFSDNGQVSGPFNMNDVSTLLAKNSDLYGWNPSFSQWLPVAQIPEFKDLIAESKPATQISKELINTFVSKKRDLSKKIKLIDEATKRSKSKLNEFEAIIGKYNQLTEGLSIEVKANIQPVEKKKLLMSKHLVELTKAIDIAKDEIIEVVKEFGDLVMSENMSDSADIIDLADLPELKLRNKTEKTISSNVTPEMVKQVSVNNVKKENNDSTSINQTVVQKVSTDEIAGLKNNYLAKETKVINIENKAAAISDEEPVNPGSKAFSDVKNKFKSVFKAKNEEPTMKLSDRLKQANHDKEDEVVLVNAESKDGLYEYDEEQIKKRRRRRR